MEPQPQKTITEEGERRLEEWKLADGTRIGPTALVRVPDSARVDAVCYNFAYEIREPAVPLALGAAAFASLVPVWPNSSRVHTWAALVVSAGAGGYLLTTQLWYAGILLGLCALGLALMLGRRAEQAKRRRCRSTELVELGVGKGGPRPSCLTVYDN